MKRLGKPKCETKLFMTAVATVNGCFVLQRHDEGVPGCNIYHHKVLVGAWSEIVAVLPTKLGIAESESSPSQALHLVRRGTNFEGACLGVMPMLGTLWAVANVLANCFSLLRPPTVLTHAKHSVGTHMNDAITMEATQNFWQHDLWNHPFDVCYRQLRAGLFHVH